ncbi:thioredoxin domain-containing protein [[Mycobacterium] kokjensenii]|uniref:Thioredoxin domain-containing protein n=1 Tax=[Mycobacterium] kokjensenii TaxID=3064287 RepID=A0ABM9L752_9MYCO|nr:thioredoxin domain-containing protein [Mycolicibacter sp. MU0083]CAJ1493792.1 thioredoxin domain-containing protein [Mycolicibacter sp. MU0083]
MRSWLGTLVALVVFGVGLAGPTAADPAAPGTALSADHFGVLAGSAAAPVQLEIFCDPQCSECAKFEADSGGELSRRLAAGEVAVTYRWMTFLDARRHNDVSARVGNALMSAADPATSAVAYQGFVNNLYRKGGAPSNEEIAATARDSGLPAHVVDRIAAGQPAVEPTSMNAFNRVQLVAANPDRPGTPTVFDLNSKTLVDTDDAGWLNRLVSGG